VSLEDNGKISVQQIKLNGTERLTVLSRVHNLVLHYLFTYVDKRGCLQAGI
jgi:hypothetical protein